MKKVLRKGMAFMMTLVMCISMTNVCVYAEDIAVAQENRGDSVQVVWNGVTTANKYVGENFNVIFSLANYWEGGYNANVKVENTGSSEIENWYLSFALDNNFSSIWNAEVVSKEGGQYVVKNANWNADIPVGGCVEFGISVNETFAGFPKEYKLLGESTQVQEEAYSVEYILDSDWGTGFSARMLLTNHTETALEDWTLEFDFDREITNIWNGVIEAHEGNHYVIKNAGYNANVVSGSAISFGFNGEGGTNDDKPNGFILFSYGNVDDEEEIIDINGRIAWDEMQDTDTDGLPDVYEKENMLDLENPDTDGDGLLDGFEVLKASSDPLKKSTLENGIIDADLDPDEDGVKLLDEQLNGTDPLEADTDGDGIIDGDEINRYKTNPLLIDTDDDEMRDGVEINLGLDPLNPQTYGYPDKDYRCKFKVDSSSEKLTRINKENKEYTMDIEIEGTGDVYSELSVRKSAYSYSLESDFALGVIPEILYSGDGSVESVKVSFKISEENIYDVFSSEDLRGIKRYSVFYLDEENGVVVPLSTETDEENNVITATTSKVGTFVVVDMEKWFASLGYEIVDEYDESLEKNSSVQLFDLRRNLFDSSALSDYPENTMENLLPSSAYFEPEDVDIVIDGEGIQKGRVFSLNRTLNSENGSCIPTTIEPGVTPTDIVFCFNNKTGDISYAEFESVKENIQIIGKTVFQNCPSAHIYIIDPNGNIVETEYGSDYAAYEKALIYMLDKVKNEPSSEANMGKVLQTLIGDVQFRTDAYRAIVFFGNNYLPSYSGEMRQSVVGKGARCIIDCPVTQSGSWYDRLSKESNGMLLYSYLDFSDDIIEFMFGDAVIKEPTTYNMISSMGLKKIVLKGQLNSHSYVDTDGDSLRDWDEVRTNRIEVNPGGGAILPTYYEYLLEYDGPEFYRWMNQYRNLYDTNGKYIGDILNEVLVLPVISDPTTEDSDGDGILDDVERTQKVVDERYECIGPFHTDTIETIYPELSDKRINDPSYPSYITVDGNNVVVHLKVVFEGDTDVKASSVLDTDVTDANILDEVNNITSRIGEDPTLKELAIDGIKSRWSSSFIGNKYDFCEGLPVDFSVEVTEVQDESFENEIHFIIRSGVCGYCHKEGGTWKTKNNQIVNMYISDCREPSHIGKDGSSCEKYSEQLFNMARFEGTSAHEVGHVMGVKDLYPSVSINHNYTINANSEIVYSASAFSLPAAGSLMWNNGHGTPNDIEMVILAFSENKSQYFVPYGKKQKMSKAIKSPVTFKNTDNPGVVYRWDETSHSFKEE